MKKHLLRTVLAAALMCGTAGTVALMSAGPAMAAEQHVSRDVGKALTEAIKDVQGKDWAGAKAAIAQAEAVSDRTDYDNLKIAQIKAFIAVNSKDYATATTAYEAIIASPAFTNLDPKEQQESLRNALLLSTNAQHWSGVIAAAERLEKIAPLDATTEANLAVAYYNMKDPAKAKDAAQKSIDMDKAAGKIPEQPALQIVMSAQAEANDQAGALGTLEQLALYYGTANDWGQLIDNALGTKGITEMDALYLYRLRFVSHATTAADDYTISADIAEKKGYPTEAVQYLQQGYESGKLSRGGKAAQLEAKGDKLAAEDRRALPSLAKEAAKAKGGQQELVLAEDYWGYGRYADVVTAGKAALAKGVSDSGQAHFIVGIALVAQNQYDAGIQELAQVDGTPARAKAAHLWTVWAQHQQREAAPPAAPATPAQK